MTPIQEVGSLMCLLSGKSFGMVGGWDYRLWERESVLELGTSLLSLPTALPLVNGYTGYEQQHSGKAAPIPLCDTGLWPSHSSLELVSVCCLADSDSISPVLFSQATPRW